MVRQRRTTEAQSAAQSPTQKSLHFFESLGAGQDLSGSICAYREMNWMLASTRPPMPSMEQLLENCQ